MKKIYFYGLAFFSVFYCSLSFSSIQQETKKWLTDFDANTNVTKPKAIKTSSGYHLSGGSVVTRYKTGQVFQFADFDPPRMSAGCGGVDMYFGGFSFIDKDQFLDQLKLIADNGKGLVFMMGIKLVSPMLAEQIENIQKIVDQVNQFQSDSCSAALKIAGGIGKAMGKENLECEMKRMNNFGDDWADAKKKCQGNSGAADTAGETPIEKATFSYTEGNLSWLAMEQAGLGSYSQEYLELMMNVVGTVIRVKPATGGDKPYVQKVIPAMFGKEKSKPDFDALIEYIVTGENALKVQISKCDPADTVECLKLKEGEDFKVTGLYAEINKRMKSILVKMEKDTGFNNDDLKLLGQFSLPIYPLLHMAMAGAGGHAAQTGETIYREYARNLSEQLAINNLLRVLVTIDDAANNLPDGMSDDEKVTEWRKGVENSITVINSIRSEKIQWQKDRNQMLEDIEKHKELVTANITKNMALSASWSREL